MMRLFVRLKSRRIIVFALLLCACLMLYVVLRDRRSVLTNGLFPDLEAGKLQLGEEQERSGPIPGAFLKGVKPSNASYCNFKYGLPRMLAYKRSDIHYSPELGARGSYRILYNVLEARLNLSEAKQPGVTYCTHVTPHFIYYLSEVSRYWDGPISVAAFVPDMDAASVITMLQHLCHCSPDMRRISLHFVFPRNRPPRVEHLGAERWDCTLGDISRMKTHRDVENLPYPVNVCRNTARYGARTTYVLVADVELIPSINLSSKFIKMLSTFRNLHLLKNHIFVLPVFEIEPTEDIPRTKQDLKKLYDEEKAIYFHRYVCSHCQKFPGLVKWLGRPSGDPVKPFIVVRREYPFHRWEPIFIGTNKDPLYSETLSWEGQQDKMTQMLEMCLIGYKLVILDGAFLVHWPGVKRRSAGARLRNAWRRPHQHHNTKQYDYIINSLAAKYIENDKCRL